MDVWRRQNGESGTDKFLDLIADPFQGEIQENSIYAAIVYSFVISGLLVVVFCFLRPRNSRVYAPRAKHADEKHRPKPLDKKPFSWLSAVKDVKEQELVDTIGLDAVVFLRFLRMLRNIFIVLTAIGCGILIPVNVVGGSPLYKQWKEIPTLMKFTPQYIFGRKFWAYVVVAYLNQGTVCFFLWWNYRAVLKLRRAYFNTQEYKSSLHSRTLLLTHVPEASRTDAGLVELVEQAKPIDTIPRTVIGRNVKDLPKLIEAHDDAVRLLEKHLAEYLSNPNKLPAKRPTCKAMKDDHAVHGKGKLDAIDYLTDRIARLETTIKQVREGVDMRNPMPYGFASYAYIEDAHAVAYATKQKGPAGCDVYLAPKPHDLLWQNLPMTTRTRRIRAFWDGLWVVLFTIAFVVPNILTSVFLSDFSHLGLVWPAFMTNLQAHPTGWAIAQGILAPLVQTLMYMGVHGILNFSFDGFSHILEMSQRHPGNAMSPLASTRFLFSITFSSSPSSVRPGGSLLRSLPPRTKASGKPSRTGIWQMQRNLGAAIDLSQAWIFTWSWIQRTFFSPTPRELIELSAPQPFPYADYYNNYLFVSTVGLCMGILQPIILPVTAFYIAIDSVFKKYLLQYVFITKTESGGRFWKLLVNRMLFAVTFSNAVIALIVGANGVGSIDFDNIQVGTGNMLYAMIPLPFLLFGFKWYCRRAFDDKLVYYSTLPYSDVEGSHFADHPKSRKSTKVSSRYGHPALYKKLLTPMVHAKSQHLLKEVYGHRSNAGPDIFDAPHCRSTDRAMPSTPGYDRFGDYFMTEMDSQQPGKHSTGGIDIPHMEVVTESELDFENFKKRAEFREQFGGDGELYGRPDDMSRPGTPSTFTTLTEMGPYGRRDSPSGSDSRASSRTRLGDKEELEQGTSYAKGYQKTPRPDEGFEEVGIDVDIPATPFGADTVLRGTGSRQPLVSADERGGDVEYFNRGSQEEDTSYERFRHAR